MKKIIPVLLTLTMLLSLCACGEKPVASQPAPSEAPQPQIIETGLPAAPQSAPAPVTLAATEPYQPKDYSELFLTMNGPAAPNEPVAADLGAVRAVETGAAVNSKPMAEEAEVAWDSAAPMEMPAAAGGAADDGAGYSGTNVQVEGIDEGDIVKTDGKYIYVLRQGEELLVLEALGADTSVISRTAVGWGNYSDYDKPDYNSDGCFYKGESKNASEMFVSGDRLAVIGNYNRYEEGRRNGNYYYESEEYTYVDFYDVSDPTAPELISELGQDGYVQDSRMLNGKIYLVSSYWVWNTNEDDPGSYVPVLYRDGKAETMAVDRIFICPGTGGNHYTVACCYDMAGGTAAESLSLLGSGETLYMNDHSIYLMGSEWKHEITDTYRESVYTVNEHLDYYETTIRRLSIENGGLELVASGAVPGNLNNQFSADEYQGNLRLVTTRNDSIYRTYEDTAYGFCNYQYEESASSSGLYILDGELNVVGSVADLAEGERIYSARFDGDIGYFCTFRNVDPLFAVDCSDPANPTVLSALKLSGFSKYLHGWGEGRLFGFGNEANEETGWTEGLKLVMFDTSDKTDVKVENYLVLQNCNYSEALYNHKAFFIDPARNIIGFLGNEDYFIFSYSETEGFKELSHFWFDTYEWNVRGLRIGDWAYIIGNEEAMLIDMTTWAAPIALKLS